MQEFSLEALLGLYSVPGIGPTRMRKLISFFGSPQNVLAASARALMSVEGIETKTADKIKTCVNEEFVQNQLNHLKKREV